MVALRLLSASFSCCFQLSAEFSGARLRSGNPPRCQDNAMVVNGGDDHLMVAICGNGIAKSLHGSFCQDCSSTAYKMVKGFQPHRMASIICGCRMYISIQQYTHVYSNMILLTIGLAGARESLCFLCFSRSYDMLIHFDCCKFACWSSTTVWTGCRKQALSLFNLSLEDLEAIAIKSMSISSFCNLFDCASMRLRLRQWMVASLSLHVQDCLRA